jgi:hypothetical protein
MNVFLKYLGYVAMALAYCLLMYGITESGGEVFPRFSGMAFVTLLAGIFALLGSFGDGG